MSDFVSCHTYTLRVIPNETHRYVYVYKSTICVHLRCVYVYTLNICIQIKHLCTCKMCICIQIKYMCRCQMCIKRLSRWVYFIVYRYIHIVYISDAYKMTNKMCISLYKDIQVYRYMCDVYLKICKICVYFISDQTHVYGEIF